jgi:hypothetical protein
MTTWVLFVFVAWREPTIAFAPFVSKAACESAAVQVRATIAPGFKEGTRTTCIEGGASKEQKE